ncbi:uncharacterized protein MONOS_9007 [Monocercomonoides exilis]|uniref:uncharacterized protein n=1 Tax=Monocercomonoides exilis TaxID=2049356 RepID=UPI003559FB77|nr:hypothetical protein MONOS_9007 [Monocercomonoides exilis]|eukprot:MONOS_9007.1-p1 / transcript=MONOS_9007.1 / gene=MONOS_9007 / organism=Monocercomonoides_exilis_PA203 / gene_product=unspecified product / transcript_product=unspecified product / location=Mono_scaffold00357:14139-14636(-) / protein_length=165 / sequence_SO=supercontig / SO=protein_coding / is_pseudo=false
MGCCFGKKQEVSEPTGNSSQAPSQRQNSSSKQTQQQSQNQPQSQTQEQEPYDRSKIEALVAQIVNNSIPLPEELDFHGWYLKEAESVLPMYFAQKPKNDICFIPGRGLHAKDGKPKIKPYILEQFRNAGLDFYIHHSGGRVTVNFNKGTKVERKFKEADEPNVAI